MGLAELQDFMEKFCPECCVQLTLGQAPETRKQKTLEKEQSSRLYLVIDAENCLHRLYGGTYNDWISGGQWNQMVNFINCFCAAAEQANIEMVVFFNGCFKKERLKYWAKSQSAVQENIKKIVNLTSRKGTPPPKAWYVNPVFVEHCARLSFQECGVKVLQSKNDHYREIMAFCRGNAFHGIVGQSADLIAFDPPRYFSSHKLKLARASPLITSVEYKLDIFAKKLNLSQQDFPLLATLLGNHILPEEDVAAFQWSLVKSVQIDENTPKNVSKNVTLLPDISDVVSAIVTFIQNLENPENVDLIAKEVFKFSLHNFEEKAKKFKENVNYYSSASRNGGRYYKTDLVVPSSITTNENETNAKIEETECDSDSIFRSKIDDNKMSSVMSSNTIIPFITDNFEPKSLKIDEKIETETQKSPPSSLETEQMISQVVESTTNLDITEECSFKDDINNKFNTSVLHEQMRTEENSPFKINPITKPVKSKKCLLSPPLPPVPPNILRIATSQHISASIHPYIYQALVFGEIKLSLSIEDLTRNVPPIKKLFRPIRQHVYSILFSMTAHTGRPIVIKEWSLGKENEAIYESVTAVPFTTWQVPSIDTLWLGREPVDKNRRMRTFLSCLNSDSPILLDHSYVTQNSLVLCCILRYLVQFPVLILSQHEVDAFLSTAVSTTLLSSQGTKTPILTTRGLHLASMLMRGLEMAMLANDACGQPVPSRLFSPRLFFDGKVFQSKLNISNQDSTNLVQMCEGKMGHVGRVERMRQAIMEGKKLDISSEIVHRSALHSIIPRFPTNCVAQLAVAGIPTSSWGHLPQRTPNFNPFYYMEEEKRGINMKKMQRGLGRGTVYGGSGDSIPFYEDDIY